MAGWLERSKTRRRRRIAAALEKNRPEGADLDDYLSLSRRNPTQLASWLLARRSAPFRRIGTGVRKGERESCEASRPPFGGAAAFNDCRRWGGFL